MKLGKITLGELADEPDEHFEFYFTNIIYLLGKENFVFDGSFKSF